MSSKPDSPAKQWLKKLFPPVNKKTLLRHYVPLSGAVSHASFGSHILNPSCLARHFPTGSLAVANALFFNAHIGSGVYIFYRAHMAKVNDSTRVLYSVWAAVLFNFGSVLLWATSKAILPRNTLVRSLFALLTSVCLLGVGREYMNFVDSLVGDEETALM